MKLDIIRKDYDYLNHKSEKNYYSWSAYVNDYRVFGSKPYGINQPYASFNLSDDVHNIEIWRTMRKKETDYRILWGFKIDGKPVGQGKDIFNYPEDCLRLSQCFTADLKDVRN